MRKQKGGIAFFDSGIGGLTVVNVCRKRLPDELFYYFGDNKHAPYGNLQPEKIKKYVFRVFKSFKRLQVGAAVVACNTATALCIDDLRKKFSFPIIGAEPAILSAGQTVGEVFVLTTRATYESERFKRLCEKMKSLFPLTTLRLFPCDCLAGEIEKHVLEADFDYTAFLPKGNPDAVVLGCTHYVYITDCVKNFYKCSVIDGNRGIAGRLQSILLQKNCSIEHSQPPSDHFQPFKNKKQTLEGENEKKKMRMTGEEKEKAEKHFRKENKKREKKPRKGQGDIIFLGRSKKCNQKIYEHLFL